MKPPSEEMSKTVSSEPVPSIRVTFDVAKDVICVAINELYGAYPEDVLKVFTVHELQLISDRAERLRPAQVEEIYRYAFDTFIDRHEVGNSMRQHRQAKLSRCAPAAGK